MVTETPAVRPSPPASWKAGIANSLVRGLLQSPLHGLLGKGLAVLRVYGHRSGTQYAIPVTWHEFNDEVYVLTGARWRANIGEGTEVEVTHAGRRVAKVAESVANPEAVARAYLRAIGTYGPRKAKRKIGLEVDVERLGFEEMAAACRDGGLAAIRLTSPA